MNCKNKNQRPKRISLMATSDGMTYIYKWFSLELIQKRSKPWYFPLHLCQHGVTVIGIESIAGVNFRKNFIIILMIIHLSPYNYHELKFHNLLNHIQSTRSKVLVVNQTILNTLTSLLNTLPTAIGRMPLSYLERAHKDVPDKEAVTSSLTCPLCMQLHTSVREVNYLRPGSPADIDVSNDLSLGWWIRKGLIGGRNRMFVFQFVLVC